MRRFALIAVFFVGTMSIFTILVQGSTMPALLGALGITRKTPVQMQHLLMAAKEVEEYANRNLAHLKVLPPPPPPLLKPCTFTLIPHTASQSEIDFSRPRRQEHCVEVRETGANMHSMSPLLRCLVQTEAQLGPIWWGTPAI